MRELFWFPDVTIQSNPDNKAAEKPMTDNKKHPTLKSKPRLSDTDSFDKQPLPDKIGHSLKNLYNEVLAEEVPDDFLNLLRQADAATDEGEASK